MPQVSLPSLPEIVKEFKGSIALEIRASDEDVQRYLDGNMSDLRPFISGNFVLQEEIKAKIIRVAKGMYVLSHAIKMDLTIDAHA
jgi:hypothetical protein